MPGLDQPAVERLQVFLRDLNPGSRILLIAELERALLRGEDAAGAELILSELRRSIRESESTARRIGDHARLFFQPVQPFLVDDGPDHKHTGRIARSAIEPIWVWLSNAVMPEEAEALSDQVGRALGADDSTLAEQLVRAFQDSAIKKIQAALNTDNEKARRRIGAQVGTPRAIDDLRVIADVLAQRDALAMLSVQLPGHIKTLAGPALENVKAQLDARLSSNPDIFVYALVMAMGRLAAPWQLVRLATKAAGSDLEARIAETPYTAAVTIVLDEIARAVRELSSDLRSGRGIAVGALLKDVHDALRGLRTELDLSGEHSVWARQAAAIRAEISRLVSTEINLMPGRVRRLMRPRSSREIAANATVDPAEVAEAEALIGFVMACRNYASELAVNEITQRTFTELQQCLDVGTKALLEALRTAGDAERPFRQSQVDAAVRFCAKVFGQDYASLLTKAVSVATHGERRAAQA